MIDVKKKNQYMQAIKIGFDYYGLDEFQNMHEDVCKNKDNPWGYALTPLNDLTYEEFKELYEKFLIKNNIIKKQGE